MAVTESKGDGYALYNGVKLPNIDTVWTEELKQTHPYAYIHHAKGQEEVEYIDNDFLCLSDTAAYRDDGLGIEIYMIPAQAHSILYAFNGDVLELYEADHTGVFYPLHALMNGPDSDEGARIIWASADIKGEADETVYFAASDPIPLDGMNVIEWDGNTEGLEVKDDFFVRLSDYAPTIDEVENSVIVESGGGEVLRVINCPTAFSVNDLNFSANAYGLGELNDDGEPATYIIIEQGENEEGFAAGLYSVAVGDLFYTSLLAYTPATTEPEEPEEPDTPPIPKVSPQLAFAIGKQLGRRILMATKPVDVPTTPEPPIPEGPTAYCLYNGVKLPNIDIVWTDKETYPYAYITASTLAPAGGTGNLYAVYLSDTSAVWDSEESGLRFFKGTYIRALACVTEQSDADILESILGASAPVNSWGMEEVDSPLDEDISYMVSDMVWVNTDILNTTDNTVYLAASDPVPVYE